MAQPVWSTLSALVIGGLGWGTLAPTAIAAPPDTAPAALNEVLEDIETAANDQDVEAVMDLISADFVHGDGFNATAYATTLEALWATYPDLQYRVELLSWEAEGEGFVAETLTTITGTRVQAGRPFALTATLRSRQRFQGGQLIAQEILSESSQLTAGDNPPNLTVQLPETVAPNQRYGFDAIVQEPLGNRILLGRAFEEGVTAEDFLTPRPISLEALAAGGLFKIGRAPATDDQRWVSGVIVRADGIAIHTRRLNVVE